MQKLSLTLMVLVSVLVFSCDPKDDPPVVDPEPTDTTAISKNLLAKTVYTVGSDVTTMQYQYDAQNKLVWYSNTSTKAGYFEDTARIVRDAQGLIKQINYRSDTSRKFPDPKLDSVVYTVYNNAGKYTHKILQYKSFGFKFKDSTVYTYDAQNRIIKDETYYFDYTNTNTYVLSAKDDYTYDAAGDLTKLNTIFYKVDGTNDYPFDITYTYDPKGVNLLALGNEAILLGWQQNFSAHTPKTMVGNYPQTEFNRSYTYKYTYNTKYRPLKADIADAVTKTNGTMTYTYQ